MVSPTLKEHITLRDKVIKMMESSFCINTMNSIKTMLMKTILNVVEPMIFYEHIDTIMFILLGYIIYITLDNFIFIYYICLIQYKLSKNNNISENANIDDFSRMRIPEIFMNLVSCHGLEKYQQYMVTFVCYSALVLKYISKVFYIVETKEGGLDNMPSNV